MTWSLLLQNGDLALGSGSLSKVTDEQKMVQDLYLLFARQRGSNPYHTEVGSMLDGGYDWNLGRYSAGMVGMTDPDQAKMFLEQEVSRVIGYFQAQQLSRAKTDAQTYGKATLTPNEVCIGYEIMDYQQTGDTVEVNIGLITAANTQIELRISLADL